MKSKFLFQDVYVVFLAYKVRLFDVLSAGTLTEFSWRRKSFVTTSEFVPNVGLAVVTSFSHS